MSAEKQKSKPLGQRLLEAGLISQAQLNLALREQKRLGIYLGEALESLGFMSQDVISSVLAEETHAEVVDVKNIAIESDIIKLVPYETAKKFELLPLGREGNTLTIAIVDTLNVVAIDAVEQMTGLMVDVVAAPEHDILEAVERHYAQGGSIDETVDQLLRRGGTIDEEVGEEAPMIRLVDQIIGLAVKNRATDIHVEPDERVIRIRIRVDGVLRQEVLIPKPLQSAITARLKIMGQLNVTEKRIPQDGRITFLLGLRQIDLRISTMPTSNGENVVIRILDKESLALDLASLGFDEDKRRIFESVVKRPYGIILVTGPTGSGKTSTLYAALGKIDAMEKSVYTLEDPIEYRLPLIRQTQVRPEVGLDFATGLRALLRQDPDVLMVGEIRDTETAELAVRAALTGHLVFSTLHTNDAAGAIPRLMDMGIEPYLLSSALAAIVGQRLVRRICENCREEAPNPEQAFEGLGVVAPPAGAPVRLWRGAGCKECAGSGYLGRTGIFEIMLVDETFHAMIVRKAGSDELREHAMKRGMRSMLADGVDKALKGVTTMDEVVRVIK